MRHARKRGSVSHRRMNAARRLTVLLLGVVFLCLSGCGRGGGSPQLPPSGFKVEFAAHRIPSEMKAGQRITAAVTFKNISNRIWPSKPNDAGENAVNLSYHWLDKEGEAVVFEGLRTSLAHDLTPGESVTLDMAIVAPEKPGRYVLEVTLVQEEVAWFPELDGDQISVPVRVVKAGAQKADGGGMRLKSKASRAQAHDRKPL